MCSTKIPLKADFEVDVFRSRITAYASFGYWFCMRMGNGSGRNTSYAPRLNRGQLEVQWEYISGSVAPWFMQRALGLQEYK